MAEQKLTVGFARRGYSASGGAEAYLQRLARGVVAAGHEVELFTTAEWPAEQWPCGALHRLGGTRPEDFARALQAQRRASPGTVLMSLERVRACDIYRAGDGVHAAWVERRDSFSGPWRRLARNFQGKDRALRRLERALFAERGAGEVIVNSEMVRREIIEHYGYPAGRIHLVRNGLPVDDFAPDENLRAAARRELAIGENALSVLFVGSGWQRKGLRFAIEATAGTGAQLLVAGRGEMKTLRAPHVRFLGVTGNVRRLYAAADIFILPTLYDPFSNACLEAMASGLPVITTCANGFSEILEPDITGTIVERADDIGALRKALHFWSDAIRRATARPEILRRAAEFDLTRNVRATLALLLQVAAKAASTSG